VEAGLLDAEPGTQRAGFLATKEVAVGEAVLQIPSSLAITSIDVFKCPQLATLAEGRSELVGLALWLMQERSKVSKTHDQRFLLVVL
jgi:flagellar biosynthesis regulator FlaF